MTKYFHLLFTFVIVITEPRKDIDRRDAPDIRPFAVSGRIPDTSTGTEDSRISGQIEKMAISIHKISKKCVLETVIALM
jgi:hypothetical protein